MDCLYLCVYAIRCPIVNAIDDMDDFDPIITRMEEEAPVFEAL